jgi:pimeloyl-ACP methyl ester carboxylesterase
MSVPYATPAQTVAVGGIESRYRRAGSGVPVVYFHGMGLTGRWLPLFEQLSARVDLTVPEHPGFGATPRPAWFRELDDIVLHQADVLSALGLDDVHLIGHSLGGLIAGSFAALFPGRVKSMTLIAPAPLPVVSGANPLPDGPVDFDQLLFNGNKDAYPDFLEADDEGRLVADDDSDAFATPDAFQPESAAPGLYRRLARYRGPRQVLAPDQDMLFPSSVFDAWVTALRGAPLHRIHGAQHPTGHLLIVQEPEQVAARALDLVERAQAADGRG